MPQINQQKPKKRLYPAQEKLRKAIIKRLKNCFPANAEAYLFGSLAALEFGVYEEPYKGHLGSDIDVIVFLNECSLPKDWKFLKVEKSWWKLYRGAKITVRGTIHKTEILVVKKRS